MEMAGGAAAMPNYPKTTANNEICLLCTKAVDGDKKLTGISQNPTLLRLLSKGCGVTVHIQSFSIVDNTINCLYILDSKRSVLTRHGLYELHIHR